MKLRRRWGTRRMGALSLLFSGSDDPKSEVPSRFQELRVTRDKDVVLCIARRPDPRSGELKRVGGFEGILAQEDFCFSSKRFRWLQLAPSTSKLFQSRYRRYVIWDR